MPPKTTKDTMLPDLMDYIRSACPTFEAAAEIMELVLENDPMTSAVAKSHRRWIRICLMQELLPLREKEREEWVLELFNGEADIADLFTEKMCEVGELNFQAIGSILILVERYLDQNGRLKWLYLLFHSSTERNAPSPLPPASRNPAYP